MLIEFGGAEGTQASLLNEHVQKQLQWQTLQILQGWHSAYENLKIRESRWELTHLQIRNKILLNFHNRQAVEGFLMQVVTYLLWSKKQPLQVDAEVGFWPLAEYSSFSSVVAVYVVGRRIAQLRGFLWMWSIRDPPSVVKVLPEGLAGVSCQYWLTAFSSQALGGQGEIPFDGGRWTSRVLAHAWQLLHHSLKLNEHKEGRKEEQVQLMVGQLNTTEQVFLIHCDLYDTCT